MPCHRTSVYWRTYALWFIAALLLLGRAEHKNGLPLVMFFHHKDRPEISVHLRCHLVCRQQKRPLCGMPAHPCSVTGAARPGILRLRGGSPCPQRSICRPALCPFPSSGLSGSALCGVISVSTVYKHLTRFCRDCQEHIVQKNWGLAAVFSAHRLFCKKFSHFFVHSAALPCRMWKFCYR